MTTPSAADVQRAMSFLLSEMTGEGGAIPHVEWVENTGPDGEAGYTIGMITEFGIGLVVTIEEGEANRSNRHEGEAAEATP